MARSNLGRLSLAAFALAIPLHAQATPADSRAAPDVARFLAEWRAQHGTAWRATIDRETGWLELLYGGAAAPAHAPANDAEFAALALEFAAATRGVHGIDPAQLAEDGVHFLPLAQIGSTDKVAVQLVQRAGGLPVRSGTIHTLFDTGGRLLALHSQGVPEAERVDGTPLVSAGEAAAAAARAFQRDEGAVATSLGQPELEIVRAPLGARLPGLLAWRIEARFEAADTQPAGRVYWIDARDGGVLDSERTVHEFEVRGTVRAMVSPGVAPDTSSNPEVSVPMRYLKVTSSQGTVHTDVDGNFSYPAVNTSLSVTVTFQGTFNNVQNSAGAEYSLTQTLPANQNNTLTMNPSSSAQVTAQGNAFHHVNLLRDWIRSIDPTDAHMDYVSPANVNLSQTCNAYFDGGSTNYFLAGGSCPNTAYSSVIAHENGHWLNVRYGTGNGMDGMGEGNADVFAMYQYDTPIVGQDFCGTGCHVRSGLNTRMFCGDYNPQCYGEVHADGEPWMGAAWKVRARLNTALGNSLGDLTANTLFLAWMNAFNQSQIKSIIETQWVLLDDDDGDINDGSPHFAEIDGGFRDQGFPGLELHAVTIGALAELPDIPARNGPYAVQPLVRAHFDGQSIASATLHWRVSGSGWNQVALVQQDSSQYGHSIPDVGAPAQVDYYVTAADTQGGSASWPEGAPAAIAGFGIGTRETFWTESFETGGPGWTHASYGDTSNPGDDWAIGIPTGASGSAATIGQIFQWSDPSSGHASAMCAGTDLGNGSNGAYAANVHTRLRSPPIDCSGSLGVHVRFWRWLSVQASYADHARIRVNGNIAWENPADVAILQQGWSLEEVDISAFADGNPAVQVEFELLTDGSVQLGGWNVDDVELTRLGPAGADCLPPPSYGPGKQHSGGATATLYGIGEPSLAGNAFQVRLTSAVPHKPCVLYSSSAPAATPLFGGLFLIAQPFAREAAWQLDELGDAVTSYPILPAMVGTSRYFQALFRDPSNADGTGIGLSKALRVNFCP